jgi:hypothetical protein
MPSVADCLRQHAPAYLEKFGERVPMGHRKVIAAITRCRTGELGGVIYQCVDRDCGREHWVARAVIGTARLVRLTRRPLGWRSRHLGCFRCITSW